MGIMKTLLTVALVLGVAAELAVCMRFPTARDRANIVTLRSGSIGKGPPKPGSLAGIAGAKARLDALKKRLGSGGSPFGFGGLPIHECNLKRVPPFKDPVIKRTSAPGSRSIGISPAVTGMAFNRAIRQGGQAASAARALQDNTRKIQASVARAKAAARTIRTRRQADLTYVAETLTTDMCSAREKLITSVENEGTTCYTIQPQEVKYWECQSSFARGMSNPYPNMQTFHCEPDNYVFTSWYVVCPFAVNSPTVRIQTAHVSINCACIRYKCDFAPYQSDVPRKF